MSDDRCCGNCSNWDQHGTWTVDGMCKLTGLNQFRSDVLNCPSHNVDVGKLRAEVERLQKENDTARAYVHAWEDYMSAMSAVNERMRTLLERIPSPDDAKEQGGDA